MSKNIGRGALAAAAAGAMVLTMASSASALSVDPDPDFGVGPIYTRGANLYSIADTDTILTAIKASKARTDWGHLVQTPTPNKWVCSGNYVGSPSWEALNGSPAIDTVFENGQWVQKAVPAGTVRTVPIWIWGGSGVGWTTTTVTCEVKNDGPILSGTMDIMVSRVDDYPDALAATTLADVADAPILLNPTDALDPRVEAEIKRLSALGKSRNQYVRVHVLGGTDALSHAVYNAIDILPTVDNTIRYQGIDRYETAATLAGATISRGIASGAGKRDVNVYLTTGHDFADALAAGAAAAENDGVVLLTAGSRFDNLGGSGKSFTLEFLTNLRDIVGSNHLNTTENFAVGGPSAKAVADAGVRTKARYVGADRYETATKTATGTFRSHSNYAIASGFTFGDALIASGFIANADGPLLLTEPGTASNQLNGFTADYLKANLDDKDNVFVFGGRGDGRTNEANLAGVRAVFGSVFGPF